jgi:hypothetical protein
VFGWFNRKPALPAFSSANPGEGTWIRVGFSNAEREWGEEVDTLAVLAEVLTSRGLKFRHGETHLELENGLIARPQFVRLQPRDDGNVQTTTTIEVNHPTLCPGGTFEYQHSIEGTVERSVRQGFVGWSQADLPVFLEALLEKLESCNALTYEAPANAAASARQRQVILGPPVHCVTREGSEAGEAHNFCPCCLFTNSFEAFRGQVEGDAFHGVRLFAARGSDGVAQADCRIDGVDWEPGVAALLNYVAKWPDRGFEYRKQFVAIRTPPQGQ